jgi:hypothetical protein
MPNSESRIQKTEFRTPNLKPRTPNGERRMVNRKPPRPTVASVQCFFWISNPAPIEPSKMALCPMYNEGRKARMEGAVYTE